MVGGSDCLGASRPRRKRHQQQPLDTFAAGIIILPVHVAIIQPSPARRPGQPTSRLQRRPAEAQEVHSNSI